MDYAKYIDHTLLKATATKSDIDKLLVEAKEFHFKSVCVNPYYVSYCKEVLKDTDVLVCTVISFPLGQMTTSAKCMEAHDAILSGADEVDMVINIAALKDKLYDYVKDEIASVKEVCGPRTLKVILETCYLTDEEIEKASLLAKEAGADFVKTSTGFATGGATVEAVKIMRKAVGPEMGVKASGGIHSKEDMDKMLKAGANRIGASAGAKIMEEYENE